MPDTSVQNSRLDAAREAQLSHWERGEPIWTESLLAGDPLLASDPTAVLDLIYSEILLREEFGDAPQLDDYLRRFPEHADALKRQFTVHGMLAAMDDTGDENPTLSSATPRRRSDPPAPPPERIGDYEILGEVGRGGMGIVYRARHRMLPSRFAAIKVLRTDAADDLTRLRNEANAVAQLQHAHIVPIYEFGAASANGEGRTVHFVAFEWVEGGNLAQKINGVPLSGEEAAKLLVPMAEAVEHAHRHGILHRDLKPSNILLSADGKPKIADFGLAKKLHADEGNTRSGAIVGTPSYMAPEQAAGHNHALGPAVDVYALGAILYEMVTGRPPFRADTWMHTLQQVTSSEPVAPSRLQPTLPRDLETICLKCLQKDPARRYRSAQELADDVQRYLRREPIHARPASRVERTAKWVRRRPAAAALILGSVLAVIALTALWGYFTLQLREERDEARRQTEEARRQSERAVQILKHARVSVDYVAMTVRAANSSEMKTGNTGSVLFQLATSYAKTASALANDASLQFKDRHELSEQYAASAVKLLGCAKGVGFFDRPENVTQMRTSGDLEVLRNRDDYKAFAATIKSAS